ncbi:CG4744 [Drosophila busckii]|uniref:CG4744 n=1 Tax=Drosophila busckii TaxID=30019 RepID=A0A0M4ETI9_DROBS|nr:CG4744 [Drosophila busckii]
MAAGGMIFLQLWWTLMVLSSGGSSHSTESESESRLHGFYNALDEARQQLHEIHSSFDTLQDDELHRYRRNNIDEMLASFAQGADEPEDQALQQAADDWFRDLQAGAVKAAAPSLKQPRGIKQNKAKDFLSDYDRTMESTEIGKVKKKYKTLSRDEMTWNRDKQPIDLDLINDPLQLDIKLKHVQQQLRKQEHDQEQEVERARHKQTEKLSEQSSSLPNFGDGNVPDGVYEQTLQRLKFPHMRANNLSHEANYKLSKIEQEASEHIALKLPRYPASLQKRSYASSGFNPMNEIKLKTSSRLMRKGLGPSLPSNLLTDTQRAQYVDEMIKQRELSEHVNKRQKQQIKKQRLQSGEDEESSFASRYEPRGSAAAEETPFSLPQSYDYHLPQYESFHALSQRTLPQMRDYGHVSSKMESERHKRQPEAINEAKPAVAASAVDKAIVAVKSTESVLQPKSKLEDNAAINAKLEDNKDAVVKLMSNDYALDESAERDKRHVKRWNWHSFDRAKDAKRDSAPKSRRRKRSIDVAAATAAATHELSKRQLDEFEDHNGNRARFGRLGTLDGDAAAEELNEEEELGIVDANTYANSRAQLPYNSNMRQQQQLPQAPPRAAAPQQSKPYYGVHRYFGPFFNKGSKTNLYNDPCLTTTSTAAPSVDMANTMNPDCVPITSPPPAASSDASGAAINSTTAAPGVASTEAASGNGNATVTTPSPSPTGENVCNSADAVKLNVSINANVCGDPKTKQFYGNGSISLQPSNRKLNVDYAYDEQDALVDDIDFELDGEERFVRQTRRNSTTKESTKQKKKGKDKKKKPEPKAKAQAKEDMSPKMKCGSGVNENEDACKGNIEHLMTGRVSTEIVQAVFDTLSHDPSMEALLSVLEHNRRCATEPSKYFYQIRNDLNERQLQSTEEMLRQTMQTISSMIDRQMRQRACIPLRPDLQSFYDLILKSIDEQRKSREKRESSLRMLADDYSEQLRDLDAGNIEQKSRIVKKLLRHYEDLPLADQRSVAGIRDELLMDLIYLRKMADTLQRSQRNAQLQGVLKKSSHADRPAYEEYSPRFIKLLKTAEMFKQVGEQQAKEVIS